MKPDQFVLERYFARYEFSAPYLLCSSDCDALSLQELLTLADSESLALWKNLSLGYTESQGHPLLLSEISNLYDNIPTSKLLEVIPEEGIFIAMNTLLQPGDHLVVTHPGYQSLYEIARALNCEVSYWQPQPLPGRWYFDVAELADLIRPNTRMLVVNFPHNPTGALPTKDEFQAIVDLAARSNLHLFSDEMYRQLEYHPDERLPAACDLYDKAISLSGLSKSYALAGLRVGWLAVSSPSLIAPLIELKDYTTICGSAPSEILAIAALRAGEAILARSLDIVTANLARLDEFFEQNAATFHWRRPLAGSVGFAELLNGQPIMQFCQQLVEAQGVMLLPSDVYGYESNCFRIGFGRKNMPEALARLQLFLTSA
jgi:aspartate/methionine/tyrosine aminotransferase